MAPVGFGLQRCHRCIWTVVALALCIAASLWVSPGTASAGTPVYMCDNERLGFGITADPTRYDLAPLKAGWYVNWHVAPLAPHPAGLNFAQIIRTNNSGFWPSGADLTAAILRGRGSLWLIGNEPDCLFQDNVLPENYARVYYEAYHAIKKVDPLARVAIGGIVQATPARIQWLDAVWNAYQRLYGVNMPVDVWNMHAFVLREVRSGYGAACGQGGDNGEWGAGMPPGTPMNCGWWLSPDDHARLDLVQEQIIRFRTWMRDHGQQNKALVVSEYGILFPEELNPALYGYQGVRDFMIGTFNYFMTARDPQLGYPADDYHLVQQWAWYSLDDINFESAGTTLSALLNPNTRQYTRLGQEFAAYAASKAQSCPAYIDLQPVRFRVTTPAPIPYGEAGGIRIEVEVQNLGNTPAPASNVRLWDGDPGAGGTLLGTVALGAVPARYQGTATAIFNGTLRASGVHTIVAQIDADGQVTESLEDNNRVTTAIDFGTLNLAVGATSWELVRGPIRPQERTEIKFAAATITMTQVTSPSEGILVSPPAFRAVWYDGDPAAGGQAVIERQMAALAAFGPAGAAPNLSWLPFITGSRALNQGIIDWQMAAPAAFGPAGTVPDFTWLPLITGPRPLRLVVSLLSGAPETTLADNSAAIDLPGAADFVLAEAEVTSPLAGEALTAVPFRFRVVNRGLLPPAAPLEVALIAGASAAGPEVGRVGLAGGSAWTETLLWSGLAPGVYPYVARVDPGNVEPEADEANNELAGVVKVYKTRSYLTVLWR